MTPKSALDRINTVTQAWTTIRPTKSFGGMSLDQFKAKMKPSLDARSDVATLENQMLAAQDRRDTADVKAMETIQFVTSSVKGDPTEGPDSELYEAMGFVRKSERNSGLSRKKQAAAAAQK